VTSLHWAVDDAASSLSSEWTRLGLDSLWLDEGVGVLAFKR
jgi:hypothetical protein